MEFDTATEHRSLSSRDGHYRGRSQRCYQPCCTWNSNIWDFGERECRQKSESAFRLTAIVENIVKARGEIVELAAADITAGDRIEVINARMEMLAQQARSLLQEHHLHVTSTECREIAAAFEEAGFIDVVDEIWLVARDKAREEGDIQELYSSRGYSWFLFRNQRKEEARRILQEALSRLPKEKDSDRLVRAQTLRIWLGWEIDIDGPTSAAVTRLRGQIDEAINACVTPRGKQMASKWKYSANAMEQAGNTENPTPVSQYHQPTRAARANQAQAKGCLGRDLAVRPGKNRELLDA